MLVNPDGTGLSPLSLPPDARPDYLHGAFSPTGEWLAFHTGDFNRDDPITLNLAHLPDGEVRTVTSLLSSTFPKDLEALAEQWPLELPGLFASDVDWSGLIEGDLSFGLFSFAWSPDGRYLAFASQMDGPSSDVYLFDLETDAIHRLTDDLLNVSNIEWSPDGRWLLQRNSVPGLIYASGTLHLLDPAGGLQRPPSLLEGAWWGRASWLSDSQYLLTNYFDGAIGDLFYLDLETQTFVDLWPASYESYGYDPEQALLYVSAFVNTERDAAIAQEGNGLYTVDLDGNRQKLSDDLLSRLTFGGRMNSRMYGSDGASLLRIDPNGNVAVMASGSDQRVAVSPDRKWAVVFSDEGVALYDEQDGLSRTITTVGVSDIQWRPDSLGFFMIMCHDVAYYSLEADQISIIDTRSGPYCEFSPEWFVWALAMP